MRKHTTLRPLVIKWWMDLWKYKAYATVWNTVYYDDIVSMNNKALFRHEEKHLEQMDRDGKITWLLVYYWQWMTKGYESIDYEIEARDAE